MIWINYLAATTYRSNEALETVNQSQPVDLDDPDEWRGANDSWIPKGYTDHWQFRIKPGQKVHFDDLGCAKEAIASYQIFKRLRDG